MQRQQVCGAYHSRQARIGIDVDCGHQVESQQGEVCQVVLREWFAAQVRVHTSKPAKPAGRDANAFEVRKFNTAIVANHHVLNVSGAIDQRADLPARFVRQLR